MKVKIYKNHYREEFGIWLPYIIVNCKNITAEEYAVMHAESDYSACRYEILN